MFIKPILVLMGIIAVWQAGFYLISSSKNYIEKQQKSPAEHLTGANYFAIEGFSLDSFQDGNKTLNLKAASVIKKPRRYDVFYFQSYSEIRVQEAAIEIRLDPYWEQDIKSLFFETAEYHPPDDIQTEQSHIKTESPTDEYLQQQVQDEVAQVSRIVFENVKISLSASNCGFTAYAANAILYVWEPTKIILYEPIRLFEDKGHVRKPRLVIWDFEKNLFFLSEDAQSSHNPGASEQLLTSKFSLNNDCQLNELEQKVVVNLPRDFIEAAGKMLRNKMLASFGVCGNKSIKAVCE